MEAENQQLKTDMCEMKEELKQMKMSKHIDKLVIAIQDLNRYYKLEKNPHFSTEFKHNILLLRNSRVSECHYLLENEAEPLRLYKEYCTILKIKNLNAEYKQYFEDDFDENILDELALNLGKFCPTELSEKERRRADKWWTR